MQRIALYTGVLGGIMLYHREAPGRLGNVLYARRPNQGQAGWQWRRVRARATIGEGDADDIHEHSPGYLPGTGEACRVGAGSHQCVTPPMDTSRHAKTARSGIPGPGPPRRRARPRRSSRRSFSFRRGPSLRRNSGLRASSSPRVAPSFRPRISVPHSTSSPRPGAGNAAAGTYCCQSPWWYLC